MENGKKMERRDHESWPSHRHGTGCRKGGTQSGAQG